MKALVKLEGGDKRKSCDENRGGVTGKKITLAVCVCHNKKENQTTSFTFVLGLKQLANGVLPQTLTPEMGLGCLQGFVNNITSPRCFPFPPRYLFFSVLDTTFSMCYLFSGSLTHPFKSPTPIPDLYPLSQHPLLCPNARSLHIASMVPELGVNKNRPLPSEKLSCMLNNSFSTTLLNN